MPWRVYYHHHWLSQWLYKWGSHISNYEEGILPSCIGGLSVSVFVSRCGGVIGGGSQSRGGLQSRKLEVVGGITSATRLLNFLLHCWDNDFIQSQHPISKTYSDNTLGSNTNIPYSVTPPPNPLKSTILLITEWTAQWILCWPTQLMALLKTLYLSTWHYLEDV